MAVVYLLSVAVAMGVLATALRGSRHSATPPAGPAPASPAAACETETTADLRVLITTAVRLAERLAPAA